MIVTLQTSKIKTLADVQSFVEGNETVVFSPTDRALVYHWLVEMLKQFHYVLRSKAEKVIMS